MITASGYGMITSPVESKLDSGPSRPYRGDICLQEQGRDAALDAVLDDYDHRSAA
jgi:hypothetical protein